MLYRHRVVLQCEDVFVCILELGSLLLKHYIQTDGEVQRLKFSFGLKIKCLIPRECACFKTGHPAKLQ